MQGTIEDTRVFWLRKWIWTFDHQQSCLVSCKATQDSEERKEIYCVAVFGSKLQLKKEVNRPGVSVKLMFFLSLETSTVAFRTVLNELLFSFLPWIWHPSNIFFFWVLSSLLFGEICSQNFREVPAKSAVFSANLSLQIPRNLSFFPRIIRSPSVIPQSTYYSLKYFSEIQFKMITSKQKLYKRKDCCRLLQKKWKKSWPLQCQCMFHYTKI